MPATAEPPAPPKQSDFSKVSRGAVDSWMEGLKEGAASSAPPDTQSNPPPAKEVEPPANPPPPAAPEPKPADKPAEPADAPADKWPRSSEDWKKFIKVRDENYSKRDSRIKELETKLTETEKALKGLPSDPAEFETIKKDRERYETEAKDLSERLRLAAIESHPKFKAYYDNKLSAQIELAKRVVGPDKADAVAEALKLPDGSWKTARIEELSVELSPVQASRLGGVLNAIEEIEADRRSEVARAKTDYEAAQAKASSEATAARQRTTDEANAKFDAIVKQAQDPKDGLALFQLKPDDDAWNKTVKERIDAAKSTLFGSNGKSVSPDSLIRKALAAEAFPPLLEAYNSLLTQIDTLKSQVAKLSTASPTLDARQSSGAQGSKSEPSKAGSRPMEVAADFMRGLQQSAAGQ